MRGIDLQEIRVIPDDHAAIVEAVRSLSDRFDHVFTSGGIGPTHDDITADAVAEAFGATIGVRADAREILARHYARQGTELNEARLRMARIPDGAALIDNPISAAPGFTIGNVHVMAGVPTIFGAMVASVLATIDGARRSSPRLSASRGEGEVATPLADLAHRYPELTMGSYPFQKNGVYGTNIVVRGTDPGRIGTAVTELARLFPEAIA